MKKIIIIAVLVLFLMEGISWWASKSLLSKDTNSNETTNSTEQTQSPLLPSNVTSKTEEKSQVNQNDSNEEKSVSTTSLDSYSGDFPLPSTEVVNGITERTIHIGVRRFAWDPKIIRAKEGELVRLVVHNADVKHGLAIPELGVNEDIPEEGAVITFRATKKGTFDFFCSVYCGVGHAEMRGSLVVE